MNILDGSRRKPSMGMPPPVPTVHSCVCYPWSGGYPDEVLFGERWCLCCVRHEQKIPWEKLSERGVTRGGEGRGLSMGR